MSKFATYLSNSINVLTKSHIVVGSMWFSTWFRNDFEISDQNAAQIDQSGWQIQHVCKWIAQIGWLISDIEQIDARIKQIDEQLAKGVWRWKETNQFASQIEPIDKPWN